jgi:hypothetical protein
MREGRERVIVRLRETGSKMGEGGREGYRKRERGREREFDSEKMATNCTQRTLFFKSLEAVSDLQKLY